MEKLRETLGPLTDWMPSQVRDLLGVEVWWLIFLAVALGLLLLLASVLRRLWRALFARKKPAADWERDLRQDLEECPLPVRPPGAHALTVYHVPVRLRLVVVAPSGREGDVDATAVEKLLDRVIPGLGGVARNDRPRIRVWPAQLSHQGFNAAFHRCTPKREGEGQPSRWVLVAGRAVVGRQPVMLGLGLWAEEPSTVGRLSLEPHQWLDVLRLRATGG
jgi:hypothetical protein